MKVSYTQSPKPWDIALPAQKRKDALRRRRGPDGEKFPVLRDEKRKRVFPWKQMKDGDYFLIPVSGPEKALQVMFRQAAARNDMEISIRRLTVDGVEVFRVTRIQGNIRRIKLKAVSMGAKIVLREEATRRGSDYPPAMSAPGGHDDAPGAPSPPDGDPYDRAALLAAARRAAMEDLENL